MTKNDIQESLRRAPKQPSFEETARGQMTSDSDIRECHFVYHFANSLGQQFPDYTCDIEVAKPNLERKWPDIMIHRRGRHMDNPFVAHTKRNCRATAQAIQCDICKTRSSFFCSTLRYRFGPLVILENCGRAATRWLEENTPACGTVHRP